MSFIPVTDITNFAPTQVMVGQETTLAATVQPTNATNKTISWSLVSGNATITNGKIIPHETGNIVVRATIENGKLQS